MKKRLILGFLVGVFLLFFTISSWAVDYDKYKMRRFEGDPWQDMERVPVIPQTIANYPSTIKFILIPNIQNLPILMLIDQTTTKTTIKVDDSTNKLIKRVKEQDER
jgi:hypothetical protein